MTRAELSQCYEAIIALWPHFKPVPATFALGDRLLEPLDARAVAAAIEQFSLEGREFAPTLGQVAKRAHELMTMVRGETVPDAHQAITEVYERISRTGFYGTPEWSHPAIGATVEAMGGWEATCLDDNPEAYRAHFLRLFETVRNRIQRDTLIAPSLRDLMEATDAPQLAPVRRSPAVAPAAPPDEPLADRTALLEALRELERASGVETGNEGLPRRVSVTAHDFGDHALCGADCPDRPTPAPDAGQTDPPAPLEADAEPDEQP